MAAELKDLATGEAASPVEESTGSDRFGFAAMRRKLLGDVASGAV
jgi:hypothetical protein